MQFRVDYRRLTPIFLQQPSNRWDRASVRRLGEDARVGGVAAEMITFYHGTGSQSFELVGPTLKIEEAWGYFDKVRRLLAARRNTEALELLSESGVRALEGRNHFGDVFAVLYAEVPVSKYERLRSLKGSAAWRVIADTFTEVGLYVRFIAIELAEVAFPYDIFVCHASEDKLSVAVPLSVELENQGFRVWLDRFVLTVGDSLRREIERGLAECSDGIVVLSKAFFDKEWPQRELDALISLELGQRRKKIMPVRHEIEVSEIARKVPFFAGVLMLSTEEGISVVAEGIRKAVEKEGE